MENTKLMYEAPDLKIEILGSQDVLLDSLENIPWNELSDGPSW